MDIESASSSLVAHFLRVHEERMQGLPILNPALEVAAIGFRDFDEHAVGVLITPWFMNLVLIPGTPEWSGAVQGSVAKVEFPGSSIDFNVGHDSDAGTLLSAALFSSVADFPDQETATAVADEVVEQLFRPAREAVEDSRPAISRRALFAGLGAD